MCNNTLIFENNVELKCFLENGVQNWKKNITNEDRFYVLVKNTKNNGNEFELAQIEVEEAIKKTLYISKDNFVVLFNTKNVVNSKKPSKNTLKEETNANIRVSEKPLDPF